MVRIRETAPGAFMVVTPTLSGNPGRYEETLGDVGTYAAPITAGTVQVHELDRGRGRVSGTLGLTITGTRGTWRFEDGEFEAATGAPRRSGSGG